MKSVLILCAFVFAISGCQSTSSKPKVSTTQYVDLTQASSQEMVHYWVPSHREEPQYPIDKAKEFEAGCVKLLVAINADGKAENYKILKSYPQGIFDLASVAAIAKWRWTAASSNPQHQAVLTTIELSYKTTDSRNLEQWQQQCGTVG
ncbi:energy transducer TonB [Shewanella dokdonensis]|uniref:Energy transducer TonB n=1 Tax=Shewanella dokdonensis TaxID=712036 RepID=A0ABX8DKD5_9GAMM|nr:energy transducer TonB [Shewanella dokdonensis]MCL1075950.1 energy transducer TonB [Shewanella dokdonensis]QVK24262.1 energy transducer TonB [Shewanella dokdonensis]